MKLSEVAKEIQEFIDECGDLEVNSIDVSRDGMNMSVMRIDRLNVCHDGRYAVIVFMG